ncbi:lipopolysaccharide core heptose(I) kinase RfaP [Pseudomonas sp. CBSPBW29]|jgi:heptose I phosphotransferase|uniref:Lipopolysaccharide core heptose(I) kinase n=1 Tax=Pseudomonas yamanorum TaxID=515393 RepID=A0A143GPZ9_9PSED|nr:MULTISPECIES: lipopolysaccharide core heptose(I) kinase RfaP [Pseudomonas]WEL40194.1 lipopolysaccharide core heptose(I) kinase RfaP [Pseudomonas sp. CBSPBW29]WEL66940.1 lipopolysaccharide core heptose(I) kinase RfaP [Pseudomonas sp. CBSPGW29]WEL70437.1 lipopolysaccharide core heptose(I) kinase RfaP [Pseudomonas sp. CBSPCGW29]WEL77372.1 lipopolysaccharide core heptose(I) kinase RfaP [Pseudomonas sp. CBSPAW29]WEL84013.1 lipopolysaccharide core heptose(I) kinase RfaP [Pseudomonas sp. CBSPCAW29
MKLILAEPFKTLWAGRDAFAEVEKLDGQVYRELDARRTLRTEVDGHGFFVKIHRGIGWAEILKNLITAKLPVLGAGQEWLAIQRLQEVGVPTMTAVAYGEKGSNPADQHSFIVTEELAPTVSLEDLSMDWVKQPPAPVIKHALIAEVARMTGMMHRAGVNHRDCYICHFLLHTDKPLVADDFKLSVIDLHRAQVRSKIPLRWRNKDLAALYFSALDIGLTRRDKLRFLKGYFQQPLRQILAEEAALLGWLERKAAKLYDRKQRYGDAL